MRIRARVENRHGQHSAVVSTNGQPQTLTIGAKSDGKGSSVNGGELLFLALATCYCNDIFREAGHRGIEVASVEVSVEGEFGAAGEPASNVRYRARIAANAPESDIRALAIETDRVAEIQNTLRSGVGVELESVDAERVSDVHP